MRLIFLNILLILSFTVFSQTPRGRVQINNGTLVTDKGTLLRGAYISTDITMTIPSKDDISKIKNLGLNCIHLYAECPELQNPGERVKLVDSIVNMTGNDSLYLILTIGGCNKNGQFDLEFVKDFWNFYAPRYKDKTHVIFEIANEPFGWSAPYDSSTLVMEKTAYSIIRSQAPETHILFMSYAMPKNISDALADINNLGTEIDWGNASIATHGYGVASQDLALFIRALKNAGYAVTITEPASIEDRYVNLATTRIFEKEFVSYTHFVSVQNMSSDVSVFKSKIESSEIRWVPDFGSWPGSVSKIVFKNPFQPFFPGYYDDGYGFSLEGIAIGSISNNDWAAWYNFDFQDGPVKFEAVCSSAGIGGSIQLHLDSINGLLAGTCNVTPTGSWDRSKTFSCNTNHFEGIHNLYLLFRGGVWDLFNLNRFVFKKTNGNGMNQLTVPGDIQIYPNPAKNFITITADESAILEIYDIQGKIVIKNQLVTKDRIIAVDNLSSGSYIVTITSKAEVVSRILIIK